MRRMTGRAGDAHRSADIDEAHLSGEDWRHFEREGLTSSNCVGIPLAGYCRIIGHHGVAEQTVRKALAPGLMAIPANSVTICCHLEKPEVGIICIVSMGIMASVTGDFSSGNPVPSVEQRCIRRW